MAPVTASKKTRSSRPRTSGPADRLCALSRDLNLEKPSREFHLWILRQVRSSLSFDAATIFVPNQADGKLTEAASVDGPVEIIDFVSISGGTGISGWTAYDRRPVIISRKNLPDRLDDKRAFDSFMSVPMLAGGEVVGVLNLARYLPRSFAEGDVATAENVGAAIGLCLAVYHSRRQRQGLEDRVASLQAQLKLKGGDAVLAADMFEAAALAGRVAHAINDPLAVIVGHLQCLLAERTVPDQKTLSRLRRAESAALSIAKANRDLLAIHALGAKHSRRKRKNASHD